MLWKLSTCTLAVTTSLLLLFILTAENPASSQDSVARDRTSDESRSPGRVDQPAPDPVDVPADVDGARPEHADPGEPAPGQATVRDVREILVKLIPMNSPGVSIGPLPRDVLDALKERKHEAIPILENWLRRAEHIRATGGDVRHLPGAYAVLAGREAVPLLEQILPRGHLFGNGPRYALQRIDDPAAADILRDLQESTDRDTLVLHLDCLARTNAGRDVLWVWRLRPPAHQPSLGPRAGEALFLYGEEADRERVWALAPLLRRLVLGKGIRREWGRRPPWRERFGSAVLDGLNADSATIRRQAMANANRHWRYFDPDILPALDRALDAEEERLASASDGTALDPLRRDRQRRRDREVARRKLDEVLGLR